MDLGIPALLSATIHGCEGGSVEGRATLQAAHSQRKRRASKLRIDA
jgi:hypothetical protein